MGRKDQHRDNIVQTAMRLFRRQGYAATGLLQIVAESGAPKGSLYHYFPAGKEGLAEATVTLAGELIAAMLQEQFDKTRSLKGFIEGVVTTYGRWMKEGKFSSGCPIATTMLECAPGAPQITDAGRKAFDHWIDIAAAAFVREGLSGQVARRNAEVFLCAIEGALILARVRNSAQPLKNVARMFASGAAAP